MVTRPWARSQLERHSIEPILLSHPNAPPLDRCTYSWFELLTMFQEYSLMPILPKQVARTCI